MILIKNSLKCASHDIKYIPIPLGSSRKTNNNTHYIGNKETIKFVKTFLEV